MTENNVKNYYPVQTFEVIISKVYKSINATKEIIIK